MKRKICLLTTERVPSSEEIDVGPVMFATAVRASNVVRDFRENIRNLVGGRMVNYETLLEASVKEALEKLEANLEAEGWDGAIAVRLSHPHVVDGGCEVIAFGTPFKYRR